ncbi:MAG: radical SAM protein [Candidatus Thermoplasmatota archaeon]|nr:radical SAM protein [Candidatus Thermoplasmatota archaeon]
MQVLRATIGNPAARKTLSIVSCYCEKCQKNRVEVALELYTGIRKHACLKCELAEKAISGILRTGGSAFGVNTSQMKEKFKDPSWRKGLASVLTGIAKFGVQKPFVSGAPFLVVWDITYACNLKCKHCYANAGKPLKGELTTEEAKQVIDKLDRASVPIIAFSGGEPLVRKDIFELTRYAHDKGIYVAIATNGTLITKSKAREMKEAGIQFTQISLDGASAKTHDNFRGIDGVYEKTIRGIKNCVNEGFFVNIATTTTKYNYKEITKIINLCEELGVNWFMAYNFVPTGRGKFMSKNDLTPDEREHILKELWEKLKSDGKVNVLSTAPQFARIALQAEISQDKKLIPTHFFNLQLSNKLTNLAEFIGGCGCGRFYCAIRPNGNIEPCVFFPLTVGNIKEDDFEELWVNNSVFRDIRNKDKLEGNCGTCEYRYYCGGCRARAYGYTGNYLAPDPGCIRNKT